MRITRTRHHPRYPRRVEFYQCDLLHMHESREEADRCYRWQSAQWYDENYQRLSARFTPEMDSQLLLRHDATVRATVTEYARCLAGD